MNRILILALALIGVFGCNMNQAELEQLRVENLKLKNEQGRNEEVLFQFAETFNSIQSNLDSIAVKEGLINKLTLAGENKKPPHEQVNEQINLIYDMLLQNRLKLNQMAGNAKRLSGKNKDLELIIQRLNNQMEEKIVEIELLRGQLEQMRYQISGLSVKADSLNIVAESRRETIEEQKAELASKEKELNTVFYAIGTEKELIENNVISKEGGFIGLGKTQKVSSELNTKYFETIDKYQKRVFVIGAKKVKLITSHPKDSYTIHGYKMVDSITVDNPDTFWQQSKYLVISIKPI